MRLIRDVNAPQPFHVVDALPSRHDKPQWKALFRTHRLAVLAVSHEQIVHGFLHRDTFGVLHGVGALRHDPGGAFLHANFFQQQGELHAGPFAATGEAVGFLHGGVRCFARNAGGAPDRRITMALE